LTLKFIDTTAASVVAVSAADARAPDRRSLRARVSSTGSPKRRRSPFSPDTVFFAYFLVFSDTHTRTHRADTVVARALAYPRFSAGRAEFLARFVGTARAEYLRQPHERRATQRARAPRGRRIHVFRGKDARGRRRPKMICYLPRIQVKERLIKFRIEGKRRALSRRH